MGLEKLAALYQTSPFFRATIANMEMVLAKSSMDLARRYSELVEDNELAEAIFTRIRSEWQTTIDAVL